VTADATGRPWRERIVLLVAAAACVAAPLALALDAPPTLRFVCVLLLFCFGAGAAIVPLLRGSMEMGLVVGTSLGVVVLSAQVMLSLDRWNPQRATYVLALACLPFIVGHLALGPPFRGRRLRVRDVEAELVVREVEAELVTPNR
jgi:peptidoglycan/LPS O-acetylase OafA/YrhL